jgi:hypothetical protein
VSAVSRYTEKEIDINDERLGSCAFLVTGWLTALLTAWEDSKVFAPACYSFDPVFATLEVRSCQCNIILAVASIDVPYSHYSTQV